MRHLIIAFALVALAGAAPLRAADVAVDLELVLAVDVSGSMDEVEAELQRRGYLAALVDPRVARAIRAGPHGRIAIAFVEWAGPHWQKTVAGWTLVSGAATARGFASAIAEEPVITERRTSISAALDYIRPMFEGNGYAGTRKVIDISGDGPNNRGRSILAARAETLAKGITINGLPIINDRINPWGGPPHKDLDLYYKEFVVGGPGAFMLPATNMRNFGQAILSKLVREIAGGDIPAGARQSARLR